MNAASNPAADVALPDPARQAQAAARLGIADLSPAPRWGGKGPGMADWLQQAGVPIPVAPNTWLALHGGGLVARLGQTEFLVEGESALIDSLNARPRSHGVYPVLREDAEFVLGGAALDELLRQTCGVNFRPLLADPASRALVLTSMVGVGVTVVPLPGSAACRVWCDGTFGAYLWDTLREIVAELGGGAVDPACFDLQLPSTFQTHGARP
jgi:sarcosine oxidase subunit gamma